MISKIRLLHWTKKIALFVLVLFLIFTIIARIKEQYRGTFYYQYLSLFSLFGFLGSVIWSFVNSILMYKEINIKLRKNILWFIISLIPFLFLVISILQLILTS